MQHENFKVRIFLRIFFDLTIEAWFIMLKQGFETAEAVQAAQIAIPT